jgi:two-component system, NarL family, invasion response regulator UvrY
MRVLIVDDHPLLRLGVRQLVLAEWPQALVDEAETLADATQQLTREAADLIVFDLGLPDAQGLEGLARVLRLARGVPVLVVSAQSEPSLVARVMQLGARGYLPKSSAQHELVPALKRLLEGGRHVTPALAEHLLTMLDGGGAELAPHERLTVQEFRVMQLIAAGRTPAQIAQAMHLSVKTVGSYRARILGKTGWASTAELSKYCVLHGLA